MRQGKINLMNTNSNTSEKLPGDYIAGFIDGEGCFYLTYRSEVKYKRQDKRKYFRWTPYFAINIREDDKEILEKIRNTLKCGNIYLLKRGEMAHFIIQNMDDLYMKIVPFFTKYPLRAKKRHDFKLWCEALEIMYKNKKNRARCSEQDHKKLFTIRETMRSYKSKMTRGYKNSPQI